MTDNAEYLHLKPGALLPAIWLPPPFRAVVIVEATVTPEWQGEVSEWLLRAGCLYMMAWGENCSSWDDAVDFANLEMFDFGAIPEDQDAMTTWHENETLEEVFWFAKSLAKHPAVELERTLLLHISDNNEERKLLEAYINA